MQRRAARGHALDAKAYLETLAVLVHARRLVDAGCPRGAKGLNDYGDV
jgi:hypothetical protein